MYLFIQFLFSLLSQEQVDKIISLKKEGIPNKEIMKEANCTLSQIGYHTRNLNLFNPGRPRIKINSSLEDKKDNGNELSDKDMLSQIIISNEKTLKNVLLTNNEMVTTIVDILSELKGEISSLKNSILDISKDLKLSTSLNKSKEYHDISLCSTNSSLSTSVSDIKSSRDTSIISSLNILKKKSKRKTKKKNII